MAKRHPRLFLAAVFALALLVPLELCGGPYDGGCYKAGCRWGMVPSAMGQTIPAPTLAPSPTPTAAEPVIPIIGDGGCNSDTPYFCYAEQLFIPFVGKEGSTMKGGSGITPVTRGGSGVNPVN